MIIILYTSYLEIVKGLLAETRDSQRVKFDSDHCILVGESARVFIVILNNVSKPSRESFSRKVDRIIIDIKNSPNATNDALTRSVATEVVVTNKMRQCVQRNELPLGYPPKHTNGPSTSRVVDRSLNIP